MMGDFIVDEVGPKSLPQKSGLTVGLSQYRNAVASGRP
jgi:hypothetical protein